MKVKKSIQSKIILLILVGILFSSLTIGGLGIYSFRAELEKSVVSTMNLTCQEKAEELNNVLGRIEQSTEVMAVLSLNYIKSVEDLKDDTYRYECIEHLTQAGQNIANNTNGAIGIYLRLNPEIVGPTEGFYWFVNNVTGKLELEENTDITAFDTSDKEHVGWYYAPVAAGKAIWLSPYENQNSLRTVVSYAMPIYKGEQLIGVVGMDIDWSYITQMIDEIQVYETGYAFLVDEDFHVAYSRELEVGTDIKDYNPAFEQLDAEELVRSDRVYDLQLEQGKKTVAFTTLNNGRIMAVVAPNTEINEGFNALLARIVSIVLITVLVFVLISIQIARTIIRPLKELDKAAQDIAQGNLDVELNIYSNDEVGTLASSLSETARQLQIQINYINNLAYSDKLTGIKNSTAYLQEVAYLKNDIAQKKADFAVFVIDANGLKFVNDNYGHELGNELIIKVTQMIEEVFGADNVYRIGGDEFAVLLPDATEELCKNYCRVFEEVVEHQKGKIWASASIGYAVYDKKIDSTYESVFNRADEDMYDKKVRMKAMGKNSKVVELDKE